MPLNVKVELDDMATGHKTIIAEMRIVNVGGTDELGDYVITAPYGRHLRGIRTGRVEGHPRLAAPVWILVAKALRSIGFEAEEPKP